MLVRHDSNVYSWGDDGKVFVGSHAKMDALVDGVKRVGIEKFRSLASGISSFDIRYAISIYKANCNNLPNASRDGLAPLDNNQSEDSEDINDSVE